MYEEKLELLYMRDQKRTEMTKCIWYWGPIGVGKSHKAFEGYNDETHYVKNSGWMGYKQQETIILDNFTGEIPYNRLLKLIDNGHYVVSNQIPFTSKHIIITSLYPPSEIYKKRDISQLLGRIKVTKMIF